MPVIESLLRVPDVAKLLGVSSRRVWQLIATQGTPPVVKIGRSTRLRASEVNDWIKLGCPDRHAFEAALGGGVEVARGV